MLSALLPYIGMTPTGVISISCSALFVTSTSMTSMLPSRITKDVVSASSPYFLDTRCSFCHIIPASIWLSSCSSVNLSASCHADEPHTDQQPCPSILHQKFLVFLLLWRFSILTGSRRKVFWFALLSPPRFGVMLDLSPPSPARGKYNPL